MMVLSAFSKLSKSPNSATLYLPIPASLAQDSQFPFGQNEKVYLSIDTANRTLVVTPIPQGLKSTFAKKRLKT